MIWASAVGIFVIPLLYVTFQRLREFPARRSQARKRAIERVGDD